MSIEKPQDYQLSNDPASDRSRLLAGLSRIGIILFFEMIMTNVELVHGNAGFFDPIMRIGAPSIVEIEKLTPACGNAFIENGIFAAEIAIRNVLATVHLRLWSLFSKLSGSSV